jgi:selenide,water dikinase
VDAGPVMAAADGDVRLTGFSHGGGCACKLAPADLADVLRRVTPAAYPAEVLVSPATGDDAAVISLPGVERFALVQTVDFFTPIVDDPYDWGRIAAANALSDVYAMGGRPLTALNIVAWPVQELPLELLARVLEGGAAVAAAAGTTVVGGHSIHDPEPKYGMAVTGLVDPSRIVRNSNLRAGDRLFLTKPLGLGVISTAVKSGGASRGLAARAVAVMTTLNAAASEAMLEAEVDGATDVTGFGLLGHLHIALEASGVAARLDASAVPFVDGAIAAALAGSIPGGTRSNLAFVAPHVRWHGQDEAERLLLADAQTSGGLLIAAGEDRVERLAAAMGARGVPGVEIGVLTEGRPGSIEVTGRVVGPGTGAE